MSKQQQNVDLKVVLLGDSGVGKTCLLVRFLHDSFGSTTATIGASFAVKNVEKRGEHFTLGLWDTAGQERYNSLSSFYCRGAGCAIIVFDVNREQTFQHCESWIEKLKTSSPDEKCFIILVGAKIDMAEEGGKREISEEQAREFARNVGAEAYFETSAKTGFNVKSVFDKIVDKLEKVRPVGGGANGGSSSSNQNQQGTVRVQNGEGQGQKRGGGCCG